MRRAARTDDNHREVVAALRKIGCSVQSLAAVHNGCPDLLVGRTFPDGTRRNYLLEVKDGRKPESARRLTKAQIVWLAAWKGTAAVVESVDDALEAIRFGERSAHE